MTSALTWLDHDDAEQRRMQEVIALFREHDTVDELGIGSVRDAFANLLFPGMSVLQSRARYFLFIPWIYLDHEWKRTPSARVAEFARRDEVWLIDALIKGGEGEGKGVIGANARQQLKLLPSYAYWNGLGTFGIKRFQGSRDSYHQSLDAYYGLLQDLPKPEGDEPVEAVRPNWDPAIPPAPSDFLDQTMFSLTRDEAIYLRERIHASAPGSLLDAFVSRRRPARTVPFPWAHPDISALPKQLAEKVRFARVFSEVMHGASLLYNLMLAEARKADDLEDEYRGRLENWAKTVRVPKEWDGDAFWAVALLSNRRIPSRRSGS